MAGYSCDNNDGQAAVVIISLVSEAETISLCGACSGPWALGYASRAAMADGVSARELLAVLEAALAETEPGEGQPPDTTPPAATKASRRRTKRDSASNGTAGHTGGRAGGSGTPGGPEGLRDTPVVGMDPGSPGG